MQQRTVTVTAAQILAIDATPVELVPAPGPGIILTPWAVTAVLHFLTAAHTLGSAINVNVGPLANGHGFLAILAATVNGAANRAEQEYGAVPTTPGGVLAEFEDQNINLQAVGAAFVAGAGSLTVTVFYNSSRIS